MGLPSPAPKSGLNRPGLDELVREVEDLKHRVSELEARAAGGEIAGPESQALPALPTLEIQAPAGAVVLFGKALLGLAGAYLLRALTDTAILPRGLGLAVGLVYAGVWLWIAACNLPDRKFAAVLEFCTSAAIVGPLLWEATIRFQAISSWAAAAVVAAYGVAGLALSWQKQSTVLARIAISAAALIAMTLLVASRDPLPFTLTLLTVAAVIEFAAYRDFRITERWLVACLADSAVVLSAYLAVPRAGAPEDYAAVTRQAAFAVQGALVLIYAASAFGRRSIVVLPEIVQLAAAMLSAFLGAMMIAIANTTVGAIALAAGIACYAKSFQFRRDRNSIAYSMLGFALVIVGARFALTSLTMVSACSIFAVVSSWRRFHLHSAAYLLTVSALSGLLVESARALFGSSVSGYGILYWILIVATFVCYVMIAREPGGLESKIATLLVASTFVWLVAGHAARIVVGLAPSIAPASRTFVLMALSLTVAWAGVRWQRVELTWLVYALMVLGAYKLLMQDFPQARRMILVISLLLYGSTLVVLPRVLRPSASSTATGG